VVSVSGEPLIDHIINDLWGGRPRNPEDSTTVRPKA